MNTPPHTHTHHGKWERIFMQGLSKNFSESAKAYDLTENQANENIKGVDKRNIS